METFDRESRGVGRPRRALVAYTSTYITFAVANLVINEFVLCRMKSAGFIYFVY